MPMDIRGFTLAILRTVFFGTAIVAVFSTFATTAQANVIISTGPTSNMSCTSNSCFQAGSGGAVLNVTQLQSMLASSSVSVTARGNLDVDAEITWASSATLTLDAENMIVINKPVAAAGSGGLALDGYLLFGPKGYVTFWSISSTFMVNSESYMLVNSIAMLASDIAANKSPNYALANDYNASVDGTYASSPIPSFNGNILGLNNTISHLSITDTVAGDKVGLFGEYASAEVQNEPSSLSWLNLTNTRVTGKNDSQVGAIVGVNMGEVLYVSVNGTVSTGKGTGGGPGAIAGGLVGLNYGTVEYSYGGGKVEGGKNAIVGGVVGEDGVNNNILGGVGDVYSTAAISLNSGACRGCSVGGPENSAGGIVGVNYGTFGGAYATGAVTGGSFANLGGLIGLSGTMKNTVDISYSTGVVTGSSGSSVGGSIGFDAAPGDISDVYWDTTTSVTSPSEGAGNIANDSGITGLTTGQLQSGLPAGFSSQVWGENATINGGLPYLLVIPPKK